MSPLWTRFNSGASWRVVRNVARTRSVSIWEAFVARWAVSVRFAVELWST